MSTENEAFPLLKTERLELVEIDYRHASDLFNLFTDPQVTKYYTVYPFKAANDLYSVIESFRTLHKTRAGIRWGIALTGHENIIGTIGYKYLEPGHKGTLMFALMPHHQNKGYITEALNTVLGYGFQTLNLKRIDAEVMPGNKASEAVLAKAGFEFEGLLHNWMMWDSQLYDVNMYAKISALKATL